MKYPKKDFSGNVIIFSGVEIIFFEDKKFEHENFF
jgi:hypothetical protein